MPENGEQMTPPLLSSSHRDTEFEGSSVSKYYVDASGRLVRRRSGLEQPAEVEASVESSDVPEVWHLIVKSLQSCFRNH